MGSLGLDRPVHLYFAGIGVSQVVSNVPAAIALTEYSKDWRVIAYGVNVGGFGFMVGSLANLIALRLSGDRKAWLSFHAHAIPALIVAAALGYALLFLLLAALMPSTGACQSPCSVLLAIRRRARRSASITATAISGIATPTARSGSMRKPPAFSALAP